MKMLSKKEIEKAVEESQEIKVKYPSFWKFYLMLMDLNDEIFDAATKDKGDKK